MGTIFLRNCPRYPAKQKIVQNKQKNQTPPSSPHLNQFMLREKPTSVENRPQLPAAQSSGKQYHHHKVNNAQNNMEISNTTPPDPSSLTLMPPLHIQPQLNERDHQNHRQLQLREGAVRVH